MTSLVIGMGIGQLYRSVLTELGYKVVTVDTDVTKGADYIDINQAISDYKHFTTVNICTPNYTHLTIARAVAKYADIVFIEKPGLQTSNQWNHLCQEFTKTRFMMVKNNQYRDNIDILTQLASRASTIRLSWINNDRVPNPGTWFTTHDLSYGGVSRDLLPHLLSIFQTLSGFTHEKASIVHERCDQIWKLPDLTTTDYGFVNPNGVYDVDDSVEINFKDTQNRVWFIEANWRSLTDDDRSILMIFPDGTRYHYKLGLCPEDAYKRMIKTAIEMKDIAAYWHHQYHLDMWIHKKVEQIKVTNLA
jgi:predicted dehydrogenase